MGILIGLTGYKQSGKDTFASVLIEEGDFRRVAYADALKEDVAAYLGITYEELEANKEAFRRTLQLRGTCMRNRDPEHWVTRARADIARLLNAGRNVVVTDLRYPNEAETLRNLGAKIYRMVRTDQPRTGSEAGTALPGRWRKRLRSPRRRESASQVDE